MSRTFFATCAVGLEEVLADELRGLGAASVRARRGRVSFLGPLAMGYQACLWCRSASRIQEQLFRDRPAGSRRQLYDAVYEFDWAPVLQPSNTLAVTASVRDSRATDSRFVGLVTKDAIVDQLRKRFGDRPDVDAERPDVPIRVILTHERATVLRDLSGDSLHRRGWRPIQVKSPLNEATAAGLLMLAGWTGDQALYDPMCGSGTFLIEAAHMAQDRAPGLRRRFAFERWPDLDRGAWDGLRAAALERFEAGRERPLTIAGSDHHSGALSIARKSLEAAELRAAIRVRRTSVEYAEPETSPELVVCNPPWGLRMDRGDLELTWRHLGEFLKARCPEATAFLLSGDASLTQPLRMRAARRHPIRIGQVDARWIRYEVLPPAPRLKE
jgi:putative N6-adenine-specific DNA methylase